MGHIQIRLWGDGRVVSNQRFYVRRAAEERMRAARSMTEAARERHLRLASEFAARAMDQQVSSAERTVARQA
jgi:hypothetical protein